MGKLPQVTPSVKLDNRTREVKRLNGRQRQFVENYLQCFNQTKAARLAGYIKPELAGHDLVRKPYIKAIIEKRIRESAMGADEVLARLADYARGDMGDFINGSGQVDLDQARHKTHLIKRYTTDEREHGTKTTLELYDAQAALNKIGQHLGLYDKGIEVNWQQQILQMVVMGQITPDEVRQEMEAFATDIIDAQPDGPGAIEAPGSTGSSEVGTDLK